MPHEIQIIEPPRVRNRFYHAAGLMLLAANFVRHRLRGYRTPRPRPMRDVESALRYVRAVVANWERHLAHYLQQDMDLAGKRVLEIGPGPDLGTGLILLARGAASYTAIDAHPLLRRGSRQLHLRLAEAIAQSEENRGDLARRLRYEVETLHEGGSGALRYHHLSGFDLSGLPEASFDLLLSHSALEHLSNVSHSFDQLAGAMAPGARLVAEVDLQTHSRWIRDADPLNIYRYREPLYRSLGFSGSPNRLRPDEYVKILLESGWSDPRLYPQRVLPADYVKRVEPTLAPRFRGDPEQIGWLTVVLCASRKGSPRPGSRRA